MSISRRQHHQLQHIQGDLVSSDPHLAAMLGVFGKISTGQSLPAWEQISTRRDHIRMAAALVLRTTVLFLTTIVMLLRALCALAGAIVRAPRPRRHGRRGRRAAAATRRVGHGRRAAARRPRWV